VIDDTGPNAASAAMSRINQVRLYGDIADLEPMMHPDVVMVFPDFTGAVRGRNELIAGFHDFCNRASIQEFREVDRRVDVAYERSGERFRATGRDLWVFQKQSDAWIAVWRTMLDVDERPAI
jgi:hypothetical protein